MMTDRFSFRSAALEGVPSSPAPAAITCVRHWIALCRVLASMLAFTFVVNSRGQEAAAPVNFPIAPRDLLQVKVFQEDDLATTARVSNDGTILMPLIGSVRVAGASVNDVADIIRQRLKKGYLVNPQVNVTVLEYSKRMFTIIGQVQKGGTYNFPDQGNLDLLQAIGMAGGYTRIANPSKITIRRVVGGAEKVFRLNAKGMADGKSSGFEILPGDSVTVGESMF